jgi:Arc/MetJ-type ribon-helix-helix transcriptional regulator
MLERLPEADRAFIKAQVAAGYYMSEIEFVRDTIRRRREEEEQKKTAQPQTAGNPKNSKIKGKNRWNDFFQDRQTASDDFMQFDRNEPPQPRNLF